MKINLIEYLVETVKLKGHVTAVIENDKEITFSQLYKNICILGSYILEKSDVINKPIAIYLPKSINCVIADLGVMISGNAYLNLDVKSPSQRIENILDLVQPEFIITTKNLLKGVEGIYSLDKIILIDELDFESQINDEQLLKRLSLRCKCP
ncbi:AMP-binding protein [Elizabethkingia ursingii]|uniref:AMP-binding protein n=1 Tax=Elizabethkingia ursingii TaxID=1756150 RepID=UPI002011F69A|nr:AMP-binding protein [Elizabethkingia ursingii]MCL1669437.1 AMP-binding protein [Elizabethkingia ursingii]